MVQGQSVMVRVVGFVTVYVLVPMQMVVGSGQKVVKRLTTLVLVVVVLAGLDMLIMEGIDAGGPELMGLELIGGIELMGFMEEAAGMELMAGAEEAGLEDCPKAEPIRAAATTKTLVCILKKGCILKK